MVYLPSSLFMLGHLHFYLIFSSSKISSLSEKEIEKRVRKKGNMMGSIARVSLRRNNNLNPRLIRRQPPSFAAGNPRGISTFFLGNVGDVDSTYAHLPFVFHDKFGLSPFPSSAGERMMMKQAKQPFIGVSSDDEWEAADVEGLPPQQSSVKQDGEALYFKMDMPGVSKEDAKVYLEGNTLMAKGVRKSDPQFEDGKDDHKASCAKTYVAGVSLNPMHKYKIDGIKAEMKNGVLKVRVPKLKDEERDDVLHVQID